MSEPTVLCLTLLAFIAQHGHYQAVLDCPAIETMSVTRLQQVACGGSPCPARAFYDRGRQVVLLAEDLDLALALPQSILLHEMVHYVQHHTGRWQEHTDSCRAGMMRELTAFRIQERFLLERNIHIPVSRNMMFYRC